MAKEKEIVEEVAVESEAKKAFRKVIEAYEKQNPLKFADKKEALFKKLESL